jgi:GT2 family glycosyltransferase
VILSHDDAWPVSPAAIARLASHLAEVDVVGVAGATRAMGSAWLAAGQPDTHGHILGPAPDGGVNGYFWGATADLVRGVKLLDGCFIAARADVARAIGFDETRFDGFHGYDSDFCWRAHAAGYALAVASDVSVYHLSGGDFGPEWQRFDARFVEAHGARLDAGIPGPQRKANARFDSVEQAVGRMALDVHIAIAQRLRG